MSQYCNLLRATPSLKSPAEKGSIAVADADELTFKRLFGGLEEQANPVIVVHSSCSSSSSSSS